MEVAILTDKSSRVTFNNFAYGASSCKKMIAHLLGHVGVIKKTRLPAAEVLTLKLRGETADFLRDNYWNYKDAAKGVIERVSLFKHVLR